VALPLKKAQRSGETAEQALTAVAAVAQQLTVRKPLLQR
jgi:hypothetical protein